jgi:iron(III) transport system substrate-binding protein
MKINERPGRFALAALAFASFVLVAERMMSEATAADAGAEWQKTVEAAKKEGQLAVYLFLSDNIETVVKAFGKKYPEIQITTLATPAPQTGPRIMAERRAGKYLWDICICGTTTPYAVFYQARALDPIKPILILPEVADESKWWAGKHHYTDPENQYIFVFIGTVGMPNIYYNTKLVRSNELNSFWDLLNPKWKGKVLVMDPRQAGRQRLGGRIVYHIPELGPKFLTRLFAEADVALSRDDRQAMDWLAVGRYPLCLFCGGGAEARTQGLPIEEFETLGWKETPSLSSGSNGTLALMNRAPHPNAAKLFINWLLSKEGQTGFQKIMNGPDVIMESMRTDIPKDVVRAVNRRVTGINYVVMDTAEKSDQAPVAKLLAEVINIKR